MKTICFLTFVALGFNTCEKQRDTLVGSNNDTVIPNTSFVVDTTYLQSSSLVAKGKVTNNGTSSTTAPWYVEAQFYTDATYSTKLGGNNTVLNFPLGSAQTTFWTISFSSGNVDVRQFPNFRVKDLRAIYKN